MRDITDLKRIESEKDKAIERLANALSEVKTLRGLIPICSHCKNIRNDKGYWENIEAYLVKNSDVKLSHGICKECAKKYYPELGLYEDE